MNAILLKLLAARVGTTGDSRMTELIAQLGAGGGMPALDPQELLARFGNENPAVKMMLAQMQANGAAQPVVLEGQASRANGQTGSQSEGDSATQADGTTAVSEVPDGELQWLRERCVLLARALGACSTCWGTDQSCELCHGDGLPGYGPPDEDLFHEFVAPAIRKMRATRGPRAPARAEPLVTPLATDQVANY